MASRPLSTIGVTAFASPPVSPCFSTPPIDGLLKKDPEDFVVTEHATLTVASLVSSIQNDIKLPTIRSSIADFGALACLPSRPTTISELPPFPEIDNSMLYSEENPSEFAFTTEEVATLTALNDQGSANLLCYLGAPPPPPPITPDSPAPPAPPLTISFAAARLPNKNDRQTLMEIVKERYLFLLVHSEMVKADSSTAATSCALHLTPLPKAITGPDAPDLSNRSASSGFNPAHLYTALSNLYSPATTSVPTHETLTSLFLLLSPKFALPPLDAKPSYVQQPPAPLTVSLSNQAPKQLAKSVEKLGKSVRCRFTSTSIKVSLDHNAFTKGWEKWITRLRRRKATTATASTTSSGASATPTNLTPLCLLLVLEKRNIEHHNARKTISSFLSLPADDNQSTAGMKDTKALTTQYITISGHRQFLIDTANKIASANSVNGYRNMCGNDTKHHVYLNPVSYRPVLSIGDLTGNNFKITMRDLTQGSTHGVTASAITSLATRLCDHGYVNYYGEQRMGDAGTLETSGGASHRIGREILRGKFAEAVDLIMHGRKIITGVEVRDKDDSWSRMRSCYRSGDIRGAFRYLQEIRHAKNSVEFGVLSHLLNKAADYEGAVKTGLQFTQYNVYIRAYQSWLWNVAVGEKVRAVATRVEFALSRPPRARLSPRALLCSRSL